MMAVEEVSAKTDPRAPSGRGHELLENWAHWSRGGSFGERHAWSVKERLDPVHDNEVPDQVVLVDRIVARIGVEHHPNYRRIIMRYYLGREAVWQIAGTLCLTTEFTWLSLRSAADRVADLYEGLTGGG